MHGPGIMRQVLCWAFHGETEFTYSDTKGEAGEGPSSADDPVVCDDSALTAARVVRMIQKLSMWPAPVKVAVQGGAGDKASDARMLRMLIARLLAFETGRAAAWGQTRREADRACWRRRAGRGGAGGTRPND